MINYDEIAKDMNQFYSDHEELFRGKTDDEIKAICMMYAAMKQAVQQ